MSGAGSGRDDAESAPSSRAPPSDAGSSNTRPPPSGLRCHSSTFGGGGSCLHFASGRSGMRYAAAATARPAPNRRMSTGKRRWRRKRVGEGGFAPSAANACASRLCEDTPSAALCLAHPSEPSASQRARCGGTHTKARRARWSNIAGGLVAARASVPRASRRLQSVSRSRLHAWAGSPILEFLAPPPPPNSVLGTIPQRSSVAPPPRTFSFSSFAQRAVVREYRVAVCAARFTQLLRFLHKHRT